MKLCSKCNTEKEISMFGKGSGTRDGYAPWCRECRSIYNYNWRKNNKGYHKNRTYNRSKWLQDIKKTLECIQCSENHPAALVFHHRNPENKEFSIAWGQSRYSREIVEREIEKCDVYCANCHNILHWEMKNGY